jgi:formylglycine-generating enzyme required for sulfatase activity
MTVSNIKKYLLAASLATAFALILPLPSANAAPEDYNLVTGEPDCTKCHSPERSYSIDYTRDETCVGCHGPGLSNEFLSINDRYNQPYDDVELVQYAAAKVKGVKGRFDKDPRFGQNVPRSLKEQKSSVLVPAGEFTMGSDNWWPKSQPEHKRKLDAFRVDKYEVTNRRYKAFVDSTGRKPPANWRGGNIPEGKLDHPAVYVTWFDANDFCKWDGQRLLTEPEWEKAARGTDARTFPWGDKFSRFKGNTPQLGNEDTMEVGSFNDGVSPYGAHDMAGNVFEWTADWFKQYPGNNHADENYGELVRVVRGGSWYDCTYYKCGISAPTYNRIFFNPWTRNNNFGFRCASDAK